MSGSSPRPPESQASMKSDGERIPASKGRPSQEAEDNRPWQQGWRLTEEQRAVFRTRSAASREAKERALSGKGPAPRHHINVPRLDPIELVPSVHRHGLRALSVFSGGGGLDLGFDRAGYDHVASFDCLEIAGETLRNNRPGWTVFVGEGEGDVKRVDWRPYRGRVEVLHGGPPCQPFSMAGRQLGSRDGRDMFPEFVRAVLECKPSAFVTENVAALTQPKFAAYLDRTMFRPLRGLYTLVQFELKAEWFGVPQYRTRLFIVGFRSKQSAGRFHPPAPTHAFRARETPDGYRSLFPDAEPWEALDHRRITMGAREALGLPSTGFDDLAPTLRSGFTGPRKTTSVNSSVSALAAWGRLGIWPHGVASSRETAHLFVPQNEHFRLSIQDCAVLQGFPENWPSGRRLCRARSDRQLGRAASRLPRCPRGCSRSRRRGGAWRLSSPPSFHRGLRIPEYPAHGLDQRGVGFPGING